VGAKFLTHAEQKGVSVWLFKKRADVSSVPQRNNHKDFPKRSAHAQSTRVFFVVCAKSRTAQPSLFYVSV
jgi:hypothetical protein